MFDFDSLSVKTNKVNVYCGQRQNRTRPLVFQTSALPTELSGLEAGTTGFEPATSCVTGRRKLQLYHAPNYSKYDSTFLIKKN